MAISPRTKVRARLATNLLVATLLLASAAISAVALFNSSGAQLGTLPFIWCVVGLVLSVPTALVFAMAARVDARALRRMSATEIADFAKPQIRIGGLSFEYKRKPYQAFAAETGTGE